VELSTPTMIRRSDMVDLRSLDAESAISRHHDATDRLFFCGELERSLPATITSIYVCSVQIGPFREV
jgi:hypothetical protein